MSQDAPTPAPTGRNTSRRRPLAALAALVLVAIVAAVASEVSGTTSYVLTPDNSLKIVAVYSPFDGENDFINGATMALDRVNTEKDGILGRKVTLQLVTEAGYVENQALETTVAETLRLTGKIARTENLLAVIGHEWSDTAVAASSIYNLNDILYLATHATAESLTNHDFNSVFALQPDNSTNAEIVAAYALGHGLNRFLVLSDKSDYGKESANFFTNSITRAGADLVYRGYLTGSGRSIDNLMMFILDNPFFKKADFNAIFVVSASATETADFIKQARALGIDVPILGMEYLFSSAIEKHVGKADMHDVIGVSLYDRDRISDEGKAFSVEYTARFGHRPDLNAALGYDALMLIHDVVERAGTLEVAKLSDTLKLARYKERPFVGVTGQLLFDRNGLITDTEVFIVRHDGNEFQAVGKYEIPAKWDSIMHHPEADPEIVPAPVEAGPPE